MSLVKRFASVFTGNDLSQSLLEYNVKFSHYLMGIGAGTRVDTSGEMGLVRLIRASGASPFVCFDVGGNLGQFCSLLFDHCSDKHLNVHSFEPAAEAFEVLTQKHGSNPQVTLNNCGLSSAPGTATLYSDRPASGLSSLTQRDLAHVGKEMGLSQEVRLSSVDTYCKENGIEHIHLLKIDVEGHEHEVLEGAREMFDRGAIDAVTFEFGGCNIDARTFFRDFHKFFTDKQMDLYRITPRGSFRDIGAYKESQEQFVTTNYLATRKRAA